MAGGRRDRDRDRDLATGAMMLGAGLAVGQAVLRGK